MRIPRRLFAFACVVLSLLAPAAPARADLASYLQRPEPAAHWEVTSRGKDADGVESVDIALTSQVWRGIPWRHVLRVCRPAKPARPDLALLVIIGGTTGAAKDSPFAASYARDLGAPVAVLTHVPNQPLFGGLREDGLVAHTFQEYVKSGDEEWPLLFPMTKAAVKAMDAVQDVAKREWQAPVERFVVTGSSKRGWTTWLTGAADPRVAGIVPMVYDNLSLDAQMKHQVETWGTYSDKIDDYTVRGLQALLATEPGRKLAGMVDPYEFRGPLARIPKLIVNGTNDPYWPVDSLNLYWDGLGGEKSVLYVPNAGHALSDHERAVAATSAFFLRVSAGRPMPVVRGGPGDRGNVAELRITCSERPVEARLWTARSDSRDFRRAAWESRPVKADGDAYVGEAERPAKGFLALFGEAEFRDGGRTFTLSTPLRIVGQ